MKFKWYYTASWRITTDTGVSIITDPYNHKYIPEGPPPPFGTDHPAVGEQADIVTITHGHFDHSYICGVKGVPRIYTGGAPLEYKGIRLSSVEGWHDNYGDCGRGVVSCVGIEADGLRIRHMGDSGQDRLTDEQLQKFGKVDILFTCWGDWTPALLDQLKPKVVFPMHHAVVDMYMRSLKGFKQLDVSEVEFSADTLPAEMKCLMLKQLREPTGA